MYYLLQGGWVMIAIVVASILALAVFIERGIYLFGVSRNISLIRREMQSKFRGIKVGEAISICDRYPGTASYVVRSGLNMVSRTREEMERAMEDIAKHEIPKLYKNLPILATVVNVATLLGLLGTVLGMIRSTSVLAKQGLGDPQALIAGIAEALGTTAAGLIVAIPALVAYNYLSARVDFIIVNLELVSMELLRVLKPMSVSHLNPSNSLKKW